LAELQRNHDVAVEWLPYELRPAPVPLPDLAGPDGERFRLNWERGVAPLAREFGVEMRFPPTKPRSRLAHEAAEFARQEGAFETLRRAVFEAYFVENLDIGDLDVLLGVGAKVGLDRSRLQAALESGAYTSRVEELEAVAHRLGVSAVPTIIVGGLVVEGVRPYATLRRALEEAERRAATAEVPPG
jgi:predicted DsbA family dithiol-disulfide isomerase